MVICFPHCMSNLENQWEAQVNAQKLNHCNCVVKAFNKKPLVKLMFLHVFYFFVQFRFVNIFFVPLEVFLSSVKGGVFLTKLITLEQSLCTNADVLLKRCFKQILLILFLESMRRAI